MSVYTPLSDKDFEYFCQKFGVIFKKAIPITQGIKNSNWFICIEGDQDHAPSYVFTLFEERKPHEVAKMAQILNALHGKIPVAAPKIAQNGEFVQLYNNRAIMLLPVLKGTHPTDVNDDMCYQMGVALASLHLALQSLTPSEHYGVELYPWHLVKDRECKYMPIDEVKLMNDIWYAYDNLPKDLPKGLCHLDMFVDNTLWNLDKGELTGLLDFTEVGVEYFVMDLAITINDFCSIWGNAKNGETVDFDEQKMTAMIGGYQSVRALSDDEQHALPIMLAYSATIFWLLRLNVIYYNREQGRTGDDIMVKNPDLMKRLASLHWSKLCKVSLP